ncbi:MAG: hypothetical protein H8E36_00365 [Rhodospirillaceae bacterium]|nr:hypothetical protein [Rhodospirillaceae bacterium]MBL6941234.1 hypothetical protein [Rhodospirillales bacterium]
MQDQPKGMERRMVHRLLMHWRGAQHTDEIPMLDDVLSRDLGDLEKCLYVIDIRGEEAVYERIGSNLLADGGKALIGEMISDTPSSTLLGQAIKYYSKVQVKQIPITLGGEFNHENGSTILYRSLIAPMRDKDGGDSFLLGAANCKVKDA